MSERDDAIDIMVEMMGSGMDRDRITAADKILKSANIPRHHYDAALATLREIMADKLAEPRDRVNAADRLRNLAAPRTETPQDMAKFLASLTDTEIKERLAKFQPHSLLDDPNTVVIFRDPLLE
jgi:hypothetical protein